MPTILALDISSNWIGWCYLQPDQRPLAASIALGSGDIADRCLAAQREFLQLLKACARPDVLAIEAPVMLHGSATIAQCRVSGAVLASAARLGLLWCEIAPSAAKKALTGSGAASKLAMLQAAALPLGHDPLFLEFGQRRGRWGAWQGDACVYDEHAADAYAVGLAAQGRVIVEELV